ncbi:hypothetical protein OYE22_23010 [Streptomyces sp. 71268]|uniref:hypothetical protein n=1 Tax=Streptomyces sp. 71268 TaxID=3002640 RepID=UPI0023F64989|nr:hypothetical protein [Streptomyces sp. 71268]WEV27729.1 hypothetical protein OYE22_23010 [Streptomyces sp. 71268]
MSTEQSSAGVGVHVRGCDWDDADAVFRVLRAAFPATAADEWPDAGRPVDTETEHPVVWSMTVDTRDPGGSAPRADLSQAVSVDLYGTEPPIHQVRDVLQRHFAVSEEKAVPGDQEMEVRLRLGPAA